MKLKKLNANLLPLVVSHGLKRFEQFNRKADNTKIKTLTVLNKNFEAKVKLNLPL